MKWYDTYRCYKCPLVYQIPEAKPWKHTAQGCSFHFTKHCKSGNLTWHQGFPTIFILSRSAKSSIRREKSSHNMDCTRQSMASTLHQQQHSHYTVVILQSTDGIRFCLNFGNWLGTDAIPQRMHFAHIRRLNWPMSQPVDVTSLWRHKCSQVSFTTVTKIFSSSHYDSSNRLLWSQKSQFFNLHFDFTSYVNSWRTYDT